ARNHHRVLRTCCLQYLPVILAQHALVTDHQRDKPLTARLRRKNHRELIPDRVAQPGHRRGTGGLLQSLAPADTAQSAYTLGVEPGFVIEAARNGHSGGTAQTEFKAPLFPGADRLPAEPMHTGRRQDLAIQTSYLFDLEAPAGIGRLWQTADTGGHLQPAAIQLSWQSLRQLLVMVEAGPEQARSKRQKVAQRTQAPAQQARQEGQSYQPQGWQTRPGQRQQQAGN